MSTTLVSPVMNTQKRKRTVVSYAQPDQLADLLSDDEDTATIPHDESSGDESGNDDRTYSRHKKTPKKGPQKKKAKYIIPRKQPEMKPFPFMELPPELRDMIYELALTDGTGSMCIEAKTKAYRRGICRDPAYDPRRYGYDFDGYRRQPRPEVETENDAPTKYSLVPNILAVSKQIHSEAINILYGQDFIFRETDSLHRFLTLIGPRNQKRLHCIDLKSFCTGRNTKAVNHCAFASLATVTNLKTLRLNRIYCGYYASAKGLARSLYSDAHFFLEAYGTAHGRWDAAIDIIELNEDTFKSFHSYRQKLAVDKQPSSEENRAVFRAELGHLLGVK